MAQPEIYKDVEYSRIRIAGVWYEREEVEQIVQSLAYMVGLEVTRL